LDLSAIGTAWLSVREDGTLERHPLEHERQGSGRASAMFARIRPRPWRSSTERTSRMAARSLGRVAFEPRPEVVWQEAWTLLPAYVGVRANGERYAEHQPKETLRSPDRRLACSSR
jgi:hypothetical protein